MFIAALALSLLAYAAAAPVPTHRIVFVGDAGAPSATREEPALRCLASAVKSSAVPSTVVFLGDNVYPVGIPEERDPGYAESLRRLNVQIEAALAGSPASVVFIPGNHDWGVEAEDGALRMARQESIAAAANPRVSVLPPGQCPGPAVMRLADSLWLVVLDSEWWIFPHHKPSGGECTPHASEGAVLAALDSVMRTLPGKKIVAAHHPLLTFGPHGGSIAPELSLFPLRSVAENGWLPLPFMSQPYKILRHNGLLASDISHSAYSHYIRSVEAVLNATPPLAYISGHDHSQQVIDDGRGYPLLVSGAGIEGHTSWVMPSPWLLCSSRQTGIMILDWYADGSAVLQVVEAAEDCSTVCTIPLGK